MHPDGSQYSDRLEIDALLPSKTTHLIEIDSVTSDSVDTLVTLNNEICHAKLDTGAQINMMTVFIQMYWKDQQVAIIPQVRCQIGWLWK